jgi:putative colanic acid biosynthesis UDP-glucose lipid carrier transferase
VLDYLRLKGRNIRRVLMIGTGNVGMKFYNSVIKNPNFGYKLVGVLDDNPVIDNNGEYLGKLKDLEQVLSSNVVDNVIVALPNSAEYKVEEIINTCEKHTTRVKIIPDYSRFLNPKFEFGFFANFPMISVGNERINEFYWRILKRLFDIFITLILTVTIFIWLFPVLSLLVKTSSKGPVLFKQKRLGRKAKEFTIYKFRSMHNSCEELNKEEKLKQTSSNDPRVTKVGKILRKFSLDELPQFINVLKGEMSIVGPRPHPLYLNNESKEIVNRYMVRHYVKPGITGWAQINGLRGETRTVEIMQKRIDYDIWYIDNWSFWLDLQIMMMTIVLSIKGDPNAY